MKLASIYFGNFKCFVEARIELRDVTCIIGENSSGKTAFFEALELTLGRKKNPTKYGFNDPEQPIRLVLEFSDLSRSETRLFKDFVHEGNLVVSWEWSPESRARPEVSILSMQPREELLRPWTLREKKWRRLHGYQLQKILYGRRLADYTELDPSSDWIPKSEWEAAARRFLEANADKVRWANDVTEAPAELVSSLPAFYQIPPVYYFEDILKTDDRADPLSRGISWSLLEASQRLEESVQNTIAGFVSEYHLEGLEELEDIMEVVEEFQTVKIKPRMWVEGAIEPGVSLSLSIDDGIASDLQYKGHGLQRLVLYGQLIATIRQQQRGRRNRKKPPRSYIIGVEEIELYLHPLYQSIMLNQLRNLANSDQFQVVYTSHSPSMIDVFDLESVVRLARARGYSRPFQVSYSRLAKRVNDLLGEEIATEISVCERIGEVLDVETCESLFARRVILVEGNTERYALPELFKASGFEFEKHGIAIVTAGGKGNIDKMIFLMEEFGIPYFVVFDQDRSTKDSASRRQSESLKRLLDITSDVSVFEIGKGFCIFEEDFEDAFRKLFPGWARLDSEARQVIGAKGSSAKSLRAKYVSRRVASMIENNNPEVEKLREFLGSLCTRIERDTQHLRHIIW